jgi:hypothetical protein
MTLGKSLRGLGRISLDRVAAYFRYVRRIDRGYRSQHRGSWNERLLLLLAKLDHIALRVLAVTHTISLISPLALRRIEFAPKATSTPPGRGDTRHFKDQLDRCLAPAPGGIGDLDGGAELTVSSTWGK